MKHSTLYQLFFFPIFIFLTSPVIAGDPIKVIPMYKSPSLGVYSRVPGEVIVKFKSGVKEEDIDKINKEVGAKIIKSSFKPGKFKVLKVNRNKTVDEVIAKLNKNRKVAYAEENSIGFAQTTPNDPLYSLYQWHFDNPVYGGINMENAWSITSGNSNVTVAVLDSGVAYEDYQGYLKHPDFGQTNFVPGYDFINGDSHANDDNGHGTHVTGTVAESTNNRNKAGYIGAAGIAYNTSIMPIKVLDSQGYGNVASVANGLYWATDHGADVINMSLSWPNGYNPGSTLEDAIRYAYNQGVTLVASAGNDGVGTVNYPAAYNEYVIAVGATRYDEQKAYYSNWGAALDITAPGGDVTVDQNGDGYGDGVLQATFDTNGQYGYYFLQGTSMAAPHVSGVAALLIASGVTGPDNVRAALENSAEDKGDEGWDSIYGHGLLDAYAALTYLQPPPPNQAPTANAGGAYAGEVNTPIYFIGSGSTDPDGDPLTYEWDFGDGGTSFDPDPQYSYQSTGVYTVSLTVSDGLESDTDITAADIAGDLPGSGTSPYSFETVIQTLEKAKKGLAQASVVVTVTDESGSRARGLTFDGTWSGAYQATVTLTTNKKGITFHTTPWVSTSQGNFIFTVNEGSTR